jgi:5'-nucleotidase
MNILIANIGNIRVNEVKVLAQALNKNHKVTIAAMAADSSIRGLAMTAKDVPIRVTPLVYKDVIKSSSWVKQSDIQTLRNISSKKLEDFDGISAYEFGGNPADAVSIMLREIVEHKKPDLVICGINNGLHMGQDIYCSSSIGMAMTATFLNIPTISVSVDNRVGGHTEKELLNAVKFIDKNIDTFVNMNLPKTTFLNINIPTVKMYKDFKGIKVSKMPHLTQLTTYTVKIDQDGRKYYWENFTDRNIAMGDDDTARSWYDKNYIVVVPLCYDPTDYAEVSSWGKKIEKDIQKMGEAK